MKVFKSWKGCSLWGKILSELNQVSRTVVRYLVGTGNWVKLVSYLILEAGYSVSQSEKVMAVASRDRLLSTLTQGHVPGLSVIKTALRAARVLPHLNADSLVVGAAALLGETHTKLDSSLDCPQKEAVRAILEMTGYDQHLEAFREAGLVDELPADTLLALVGDKQYRDNIVASLKQLTKEISRTTVPPNSQEIENE